MSRIDEALKRLAGVVWTGAAQSTAFWTASRRKARWHKPSDARRSPKLVPRRGTESHAHWKIAPRYRALRLRRPPPRRPSAEARVAAPRASGHRTIRSSTVERGCRGRKTDRRPSGRRLRRVRRSLGRAPQAAGGRRLSRGCGCRRSPPRCCCREPITSRSSCSRSGMRS